MHLHRLAQVIFLFTLAACSQGPVGLRLGYDDSTGESKNSKVQGRAISFAEVNEKVFKVSCQSCHSSDASPHLSSYEEYKANIAKVRHQVIEVQTMPKRAPLAQADQDLLKAWIDQGAPLQGEAPPVTAPPAQSPTSAAVTWAEVNKKIFITSCTSCHFKNNPAAISNLEDLEQVRATMGTIYYTTVTAPIMPPPPKGSAENAPNPNQLSDDLKELLSRWVIQGMKE